MNNDWIERPYGWKKELDANSQLIRINPHNHTSMSATPETLGPYGLKIDDAIWEHIEFLGYVDSESDEKFSLRYVFLPLIHELSEQPKELRFRSGARFYCVLPDEKRTGFYNNLFNDSEKIIELRVEWR